MEREALYEAYKASRKHNKRSEDMIAFEVDLYANLRELEKRINSRTYTPLHNYSFIHRRSQTPREVFAAEPQLKIMMAYALLRISPIIERHLSPRTFNNRVGMGMQLAVNTLIDDIYEVSRGYTKPCWVIKIDYKGYFPNMSRDFAWGLIGDIVNMEYRKSDKQDVLYCLQMACFCTPKRSRRKSPLWEWANYPQYKSVYSKPDGIGGFIGYTFWQMIASLYPVTIDTFISDNISGHFVRYVDDTVIVTDDKDMALSALPDLRSKLKDIGIEMHPKKFYCQQYQHGVEFLGYRILPRRIHIKRRTVEKAITVANSGERGNRNYMSAVNSYLGMIKATSDTNKCVDILNAVKRRRFEKDYTNYKLIMK